MSDDDKIYVDAGQPATLNNGAGKLTDYRTLQGAVMAWHLLPPEQLVDQSIPQPRFCVSTSGQGPA
jgi:hypothetical protein